ncbi:hypothetical protein TGME49_254335 [Toxoplasma gondii ME49]|uniref:Uncharacterized protein n=9 Tax=Toxoplasma gondii TaxID=5811 RepID=S7VVJ8_TOXGG|nr:hypothetical protein TGME49_254335 [Toxoplasma gondii ME49]EPR59069.1 hypothetical protein TGGT1_254335 [Toxoplasma gondii GT1]KFG53012.1 hypothetical protein TGFOU_254335 [Toxoplasma gondii FOU]KFG59980.1 hypothetical protein TGRUB_254335 [Toxoplasma gondii RUB]KFH06656.1 hypothetical protein TGVAND_254335 [Toxoplasma gondii VAND]KFH15023.1 hypothetical protein TGMAS_254335 [Toxoplasma gondii MAS]PIL98040.1 hypothetical protein TGCOUG_254335 [Toxoplasma gondii COUG]PUA89013.1 hypothetica|eukprot:XP_018638140.1 hypothetical protein TGME49_254335 [Toxoplasma gondii ME49]
MQPLCPCKGDSRATELTACLELVFPGSCAHNRIIAQYWQSLLHPYVLSMKNVVHPILQVRRSLTRFCYWRQDASEEPEEPHILRVYRGPSSLALRPYLF